MSEEDRAITQKIRQALMDDNTLGVQAKNIKIITAKGVVTLRGVVKDDQERILIGNKAKSIPNVKRIDNQIEIIMSPN
jgi:osmotically-inducible protein OsmY